MTSSGLEIVNTDGAVVSLIVSGSYARSISERWDRPGAYCIPKGRRRFNSAFVVNLQVSKTSRRENGFDPLPSIHASQPQRLRLLDGLAHPVIDGATVIDAL